MHGSRTYPREARTVESTGSLERVVSRVRGESSTKNRLGDGCPGVYRGTRPTMRMNLVLVDDERPRWICIRIHATSRDEGEWPKRSSGGNVAWRGRMGMWVPAAPNGKTRFPVLPVQRLLRNATLDCLLCRGEANSISSFATPLQISSTQSCLPISDSARAFCTLSLNERAA